MSEQTKDPFAAASLPWPGDEGSKDNTTTTNNNNNGSTWTVDNNGFGDSSTPWDGRTAPVVTFNQATDESLLLNKQDASSNKPSTSHYGSTSLQTQSITRVSKTSQSAGGTTRRPPGVLRNFSSNTDPGEQITLTWEDIYVSLPPKTSLIKRGNNVETAPRKILKGVSGIVHPGTLLAIMGASGSGKTTLLNVLTTRNVSDLVISGDVKVNGLPVGAGITSLSAYVQQEDLFVGVLTVKEHLWFQAMLRMDNNLTNEERQLRIDEVVQELGLNKCKNTVIGVPGRVKSISGGERKRLAFASEVLTNPPLMFCDEPTSGLDSFMAENVVQTLRGMASKGKTILCTIHQPSSQVFALFDNLLLLAEGRIAYMGSAAGARDFFMRAGHICPQQFNPADFYIHTLAVVPGKEAECRTRIEKICDTFAESNENTHVKTALAKVSSVLDNIVISPTAMDLSKVSPYKANYLRQLKYVAWRSWLTNVRDKALLQVRLIQNIIIALFAGLLYLGQPNNQKAVQNINGAIFLILTNATYSNAFSVINVFPSELAIFKREHQNGMYRVSVYYICKTMSDIPVFILLPIIFSTVMYWMVGMRPDVEAFFICVGTAILLTHVVVSFGYFVSTLAGDVSVALSIAGPICVPFMLFGGFFLNDASIPVYFIWLEYLSWFKYANEILVVNQWQNYGNLTCEYLPVQNSTSLMASAYSRSQHRSPPMLTSNFRSVMVGNSTGNSTIPSSRCFKNGQEVVSSLNYSYDNLTRDFLALTALLVGFRYLGYLCLLLRAKPRNFREIFFGKKSTVQPKETPQQNV